jgi:DNA helicase HerA-like ATPase
LAERVITGGWRDDLETEPFPIATTSHGGVVVFTREERERHIWIVGKSGSGKSTFLFNLVMDDICAGEGVAVIDPHGDLATDILDAVPRRRINDVCYLDAGETEYPLLQPRDQDRARAPGAGSLGHRRRVQAPVVG